MVHVYRTSIGCLLKLPDFILIASVVGGLISLFVMVIGSQHRVILFDYADPWLWMGPLMLLIGIITATISWQIYYIARTNPAEVIKNE